MPTRNTAVTIERIEVSAYTIPTDLPEGDGTISWDATTLVVIEATAGGAHGLGYTYADTATALLIRDTLAEVIRGHNAFDVPGAWAAMVHSIRNLGRPGIASMAISGVDVALWDLKAKLLDLPLCKLLGQVRDAVPIYGSGGFTTYSVAQLQKQLGDWAEQGIPRVKMKIGAHPEDDLSRVRAAREAIGPRNQLYVDANGAYTRKQALAQAEAFAELGVVWFEEPVSSDDLEGLRLIRDRAPAGMNIAAGEYGYDLWYFRRMLDAGAVDVQQADGLALRRRHWIFARGFAGGGAQSGALGALRPLVAPARLLRGTQSLAHRILPRPRSHRGHALRWRRLADRWRVTSGSLTSRHRPRLQAAGRQALRCLARIR